MNKPDTTIRAKDEPPRGILHLRVAAAEPGYGRFLPGPALAPFVEHFWTVAWDVPAPVVREVLPHPSVHVVLEADAGQVAGVPRGRFVRTLAGRGRVLGTKFRPGGFRGFLRGPVAALTGRTVPIETVLGPAAAALAPHALAQEEATAGFAIVQEFLAALAPPPDPDGELAASITESIAADRELLRVEQVARRAGLGERALQRLFREYVGVSPKWVIQRYRLHEAAERVAAGDVADWAGLAAELGYADQAHFIRDFKRLVGRTPADYAAAFDRR